MKASKKLDLLYKIAKYLKDIKCTCGFEGVPTWDGRCPKCGLIGGVAPAPITNERGHLDDIPDREQNVADLHGAIQESIEEFYSAY